MKPRARRLRPGPFDYNLGLDFLKGLTTSSKIRFLSSNVFQDGKEVFAPYVIVDKAGLKIAILSVTPQGQVEDKRLTVKGAEETLNKWVAELTAKADMIILLSQFTVKENEPLAEKYPAIHLIVGADEKMNLGEPLWFAGHTLVLDPHFNGFLLGKLEMDYKTPFKGFYSPEIVKRNQENKAALEANAKADPTDKTAKDLLARMEKEDSLVEIAGGSTFSNELVKLDAKRYGKPNAVTAAYKKLKEKIRKKALEE